MRVYSASWRLRPVTLSKSKTFMRANLDLAAEVTLVDAAKTNATAKDLYLLLPGRGLPGAAGRRAMSPEALARGEAARDDIVWMVSGLRTGAGPVVAVGG